MNGYIEQIDTGGFKVFAEGQLVAILPTREAAEEMLVMIYLFHNDTPEPDEPIQ
jgi:hypothetical protein